ncbi:hypothetical protein D3C71_1141740 [compost metagenome]
MGDSEALALDERVNLVEANEADQDVRCGIVRLRDHQLGQPPDRHILREFLFLQRTSSADDIFRLHRQRLIQGVLTGIHFLHKGCNQCQLDNACRVIGVLGTELDRLMSVCTAQIFDVDRYADPMLFSRIDNGLKHGCQAGQMFAGSSRVSGRRLNGRQQQCCG